MKKILISAFIVVNLMMMLRAQLSDKSALVKFIYLPVTPIQNYFSMWRGWEMFAPNPLRINAFIDAAVLFEDGSELIWGFPRAKNDDLWGKYFWSERFRKYLVDAVRLDKYSFLWRDAALFTLKKVSKENPNKKVKQIILRRRWKNINSWKKDFIPHRTSPNEESYSTYNFYTFKVKRL